MSEIDKLHNIASIISGSFWVDEAAIDELRANLEQQCGRKISLDEAEKTGRSLIAILETLANGRKIVAGKGGYGCE
jgi:hypothetical protein